MFAKGKKKSLTDYVRARAGSQLDGGRQYTNIRNFIPLWPHLVAIDSRVMVSE